MIIARRIGRHQLIDRDAALTYHSVLSLAPGLFGDLGTVRPNEVERAARDPLSRWSGMTLGRGPFWA